MATPPSLLALGARLRRTAAAGRRTLSGRGASLVAPRPRARAVASDETIPTKSDVVVVGAGIVGLATALTLAERGLSVTVCEKGVVAGEASGRAIGWIDNTFQSVAKAELISRSKELWAGLNERTGAETGYRKSGLVVPFATYDEAEPARAWIESMRDAPGAIARIVGADEANRLIPADGRRWVGALVNEGDGHADPKLAAPAVADAFRRVGGRLLQSCAVRGIETAGGRVHSVVTEMGAFETSAVVLAGGVWSPLLLRSLGFPLPQLLAFASAMSIAAPSRGPAQPGMRPGVIWRNEDDGGYTLARLCGAAPVTPVALRWFLAFLPAVKAMWSELDPVLGAEFLRQWRLPKRWSLDGPSPFEGCRILEPEVREWVLEDARDEFRSVFLGDEPPIVRERWAGALSTLPDNMPVLSSIAARPGLFVASGLYYGLTMGPAAGELIADLVMGQTPHIDPTLFRYERFFDGSRIVFQA